MNGKGVVGPIAQKILQNPESRRELFRLHFSRDPKEKRIIKVGNEYFRIKSATAASSFADSKTAFDPNPS